MDRIRRRLGASARWGHDLLEPWVREPFNGVSHAAGALLAVAGLIALVVLSAGRPWQLAGCLVYGLSLVLLYVASTLYHTLHVGAHGVEKLRTFDQVAIYLLIAGTYTPLCLGPLRTTVGPATLIVIWSIAIAGIWMRLAWKRAPEWLAVSLYLVMGWLAVAVAHPISVALPHSAPMWLFGGGIIYTVGAVVFATQRPRLWPGLFSSHELWHLFVLGGSACHFVLMYRFVAGAH